MSKPTDETPRQTEEARQEGATRENPKENPAQDNPQDDNQEPRRNPPSFAERILALYSDELSDELSDGATELIRKRRVIDFVVQPGRVSAKVNDESSQSVRVQLTLTQFSDAEWQGIFEAISKESFYTAMLLCDTVPPEMEQVFEARGLQLFPKTKKEIELRINDEPEPALSRETAAVLLRLYDKLHADPLAMLELRGRSREETFLELKKLRALLREKKDFKANFSGPQVQYEPAPPLISTVDRFWSYGSGVEELSYTIRADELPASILKWLDPLPLGGLEDEVDYLLEEAYERIARLAQSYGLNL